MFLTAPRRDKTSIPPVMATTTNGTSFGSQEKNTGILGFSQESCKVAKLITNSEEPYPSELTITSLDTDNTGAHQFSRRQSLAEGRMWLKCHSPSQTPPWGLSLLQSARKKQCWVVSKELRRDEEPEQSGNINPRETVKEAIGICNLFINSYAIIRNFLK